MARAPSRKSWFRAGVLTHTRGKAATSLGGCVGAGLRRCVGARLAIAASAVEHPASACRPNVHPTLAAAAHANLVPHAHGIPCLRSTGVERGDLKLLLRAFHLE